MRSMSGTLLIVPGLIRLESFHCFRLLPEVGIRYNRVASLTVKLKQQ